MKGHYPFAATGHHICITYLPNSPCRHHPIIHVALSPSMPNFGVRIKGECHYISRALCRLIVSVNTVGLKELLVNRTVRSDEEVVVLSGRGV
jgi:hypothetical protein